MDANFSNITCVIEPRHETEIPKVRKFAENPKNYFDHDKALLEGRPTPEDNPKHVVKFRTNHPNIGWRVIYSVDVIDGQLFRRLAVVLRGAPDRAPSEGVMTFIAKQFGLEEPFEYLGPSKWPFHFERAIHLTAKLEEGTDDRPGTAKADLN